MSLLCLRHTIPGQITSRKCKHKLQILLNVDLQFSPIYGDPFNTPSEEKRFHLPHKWLEGWIENMDQHYVFLPLKQYYLVEIAFKVSLFYKTVQLKKIWRNLMIQLTHCKISIKRHNLEKTVQLPYLVLEFLRQCSIDKPKIIYTHLEYWCHVRFSTSDIGQQYP